MAFHQAMSWSEGEEKMQHALGGPDSDNPTVPMLTQQAASMLQRAPLLALGCLDSDDKPWTTIWGGDTGFSQAIGQSIIGIKTPVPPRHDPVVEILVGSGAEGEIVREQGKGRMVSALTIDLETRKRVKLYGRMVAGALGLKKVDPESSEDSKFAEVQLVVKVEQSLGNCPKYLNKKSIIPAPSAPTVISGTTTLNQDAAELVTKSDLFFVSSSNSTHDMDTNHRGGPPGFVRLLSNDNDSTVLVWPEYSGNRLYQTLGNLAITPRAGLCFPDFVTGNCLYLTGTTETLIGKDAAAVLPRSNLAVKFTVTAARFVGSILPFRGKPGELSPYNPAVRYLSTEQPSAPTSGPAQPSNTAKLLRQHVLTPTISRFHFSLSNAATYKSGQYVTLDFSSHLDIGYSHMRDDDPRSLNDDFVRTFTVSSPPGLPKHGGPNPVHRLADDEFEITIRKVGVVTGFLFKYGIDEGRYRRPELEIDVKGFGGSFEVKQENADERVAFVAAGVGITPLMPCLQDLDLSRLSLLWALRKEDIGVAVDLVRNDPSLGGSIQLFLTGEGELDENQKADVEELKGQGVFVKSRRMVKEDLDDDTIKRWYVCTGTAQRKAVLQWLAGQEVLFEDYNF